MQRLLRNEHISSLNLVIYMFFVCVCVCVCVCNTTMVNSVFIETSCDMSRGEGMWNLVPGMCWLWPGT